MKLPVCDSKNRRCLAGRSSSSIGSNSHGSKRKAGSSRLTIGRNRSSTKNPRRVLSNSVARPPSTANASTTAAGIHALLFKGHLVGFFRFSFDHDHPQKG